MSRVFVGNLEPQITEQDLEDEFRVYGAIRSIWVARRPPGYSFIDFDERRDAEDAIRDMDGKHGWRVELSYKSAEVGRGVGGRGRDRYGSLNFKCYNCGEPGHLARECHLIICSGGRRSGRHRSPSPRFRRSPSYGRSPRDWSPRHRNFSSRHGRSYSRSPPYLNGRNGAANGRRRSRSRS